MGHQTPALLSKVKCIYTQSSVTSSSVLVCSVIHAPQIQIKTKVPVLMQKPHTHTLSHLLLLLTFHRCSLKLKVFCWNISVTPLSYYAYNVLLMVSQWYFPKSSFWLLYLNNVNVHREAMKVVFFLSCCVSIVIFTIIQPQFDLRHKCSKPCFQALWTPLI